MSQANCQSQFGAESCQFQLQTQETVLNETHWISLPAAPPNAGKWGGEGYSLFLGVSSADPKSPGTFWSHLTSVRRLQGTARATSEAPDNCRNFVPPFSSLPWVTCLALPLVEGTSFLCRPKGGNSFYSNFAAHCRIWGGWKGVL